MEDKINKKVETKETALKKQEQKNTPAVENKSKDTKPKKSKKGCCIAIGVVAVILLLSSLRGLAFLGLGSLSWFGNSNNADIIPPDLQTSDTTTSPTATSGDKNKSSSSSSSKTNNPSSSSGSSSSESGNSSNTTEPADGSGEAPASGATPQTTFTRQEQINFFVQVAMKNDLNNFSISPVIKWTSNSGTIRYYNNPSGANLACADQTISLINGLSNTIRFQKTTSEHPSIRVFFVPKSQLGSVGGYYNFSTGANGQIIGGNAYVPVDAYNDIDRCHYIRHEMTHVMTGLPYNGLKNHGGYDFSIFNVTAGRSDYLEVDKTAIRIMLNSGVGLGWNESHVRSFLSTANW